MSEKVNVGDVRAKIKARPPIEYLRKLAGSPEQAEEYLKRAQEADFENLSAMGQRDILFEVYIPLLDKRFRYGMPSLNGLAEWQRGSLEGKKELLKEKADMKKAGVDQDDIDAQLKELEKIQNTEQMGTLVYLMLRRADKELTETMVAEWDVNVLTQFVVSMGENTPFLQAAQPNPVSSTPRKPQPQ